MSVLPPFCLKYIPKPDSTLPKPLTSFYNKEFRSCQFEELHEECSKILKNFSISKEEVAAVECKTKEQNNKVWLQQRAGRITASNMKDACHTDPLKPSITVVKRICYPEEHQFSSPQTQWGKDKEEPARKCYVQTMRKTIQHQFLHSFDLSSVTKAYVCQLITVLSSHIGL